MYRLLIVKVLLTALCVFVIGYWAGSKYPLNGGSTTKVEEASRSYSRGSERAEELHKVVVTERTRTTKKPDGTVVTDVVAIKAVNDYHSIQSEREKAQETIKVTQATSKNYTHRLSIYMPPRYPVTSYKDIRVEVTQRLVGPVVIGLQVSLAGEVLIGLGIEF